MSATYSWFKTKGGRAGRRILSLTPLKNSFPLADHQGEDVHSSDEDDPFAVATDSLGRGGGVWNGGLGGSTGTSPTIGRAGTTNRKKKGHVRHKSHAITDYDYKDKVDSVIRKVLYHDRDHVSVMFQMHGSVWPQVLPFCIFNIGFTFLVYYLKVWGYDITSSTIGHKFMSTMVRSFYIYTHVYTFTLSHPRMYCPTHIIYTPNICDVYCRVCYNNILNVVCCCGAYIL
jgi:hypothetical protein